MRMSQESKSPPPGISLAGIAQAIGGELVGDGDRLIRGVARPLEIHGGDRDQQKAVSRNQVFLLIRSPAADFLDVGLSTIASLSDGSLALVPTLSYSLSDNVELTLYLNTNIGKIGKAYGRSSGTGGMLRARVYF